MNTIANSIALGQPNSHAPGDLFLTPSRSSVADLPAAVPEQSFFNPALPWLHSVCDEPDFLNPWMAQANASWLSFELGTDVSHPCRDSCTSSRRCKRPQSPGVSVSSRTVRFCQDLQLYIGLDEHLHFHELELHVDSLSFHDKPWGSYFPIAGPHVSHVITTAEALRSTQYEVSVRSHGNSTEWDPMSCSCNLESVPFIHSVADITCCLDRNDMHPPGPADVDVGTDCAHRIGSGETTDIPQVLSASLSPAGIFRSPSDLAAPFIRPIATGSSHDSENCTVGSSRWHAMLLNFSDRIQSIQCRLASQLHVTSSLFTRGDSMKIPAPRHRTPANQFPPVWHHRREHESPIVWPDNMPPSDDEDEEDDLPPDHPADPAFMQRLIAKFYQLGLNVHSDDFEIPLRTWYLDHVNMRRWTSPRNLQLTGPPRGWEQQFNSLWIDQLDPEEWFDLTIIQPDPPRQGRQALMMMDVVVTQSLHMNRFAGLVTVMPVDGSSFDMFAVAYSFADFISGFDIVLAADATDFCRYNPCTVTFGWDTIPLSLQPFHAMRHGDGFQLLVRQSPASAVERASGSADAPRLTEAPDHAPDPDDATMPVQDQMPPVTPADLRFTTPLHLFQLQAHEIILQLSNSQLAQPSHEIAAAANVPFQCLEAVHLIVSRPLDFPELAIPAILQRVGDVPLHSTKRLILIDVVYHHHPDIVTPPNRPTVLRTVHTVEHHVLRSQLLLVAAVFHYCEFLRDGCEVSLDGIFWHATEHSPRPVRHGSYAKIEVPPPTGFHVDTMVAADIFHADSQRDDSEIFRELFEGAFDGDDDTALLQSPSPGPTADTKNGRSNAWFRSAPLCHDVSPRYVPELPSAPSGADVVLGTFAPTALPEHEDVVGYDAGVTTSTTGLALHRPEQNLSRSSPPVCSAPNADKSAVGPSGSGLQTTIMSFFQRRTQPSLPSLPCDQNQPVVNKCSDSQQQAPPVLTQAIPPPVPAMPAARPRPIWQLELQAIFDEFAAVHFTATGPTLHVSVWYVHHQTHPTCAAPRQVQLDDMNDLWYADLCQAWWDRVQRTQPMKVQIVKPNPDNQLSPHTQRHIILEQGFSPDKAAIVFTAVFLANYRNGVLQKADSVDIQISTQYIIDKYRLNEYCDFRPCTMTSGIMRFHQHIREEIFSGISVHFVVGRVPLATPSASSRSRSPPRTHDHDNHDDVALMQRPRRWNRPRAPAPAASYEPTHAPQAGRSVPGHLSLSVVDPREFRETLQWTIQAAAEQCHDTRNAPFQVQTWFLDPYRCTRTSEARTILLQPHPHTWSQDITNRWADVLDPQEPVHLHVVHPMPVAATSEVRAYILLVQRPNGILRASLVSVIHFDQDPWNPSHIAVMLDAETTVEQIAFVTNVVHPANPQSPYVQVEARHASVTLDDRAPFHVRDGYAFELVVFDNSDPWADSLALIQLSFASVKAHMRSLHQELIGAQRSMMLTPESQDLPALAAMSITQDPRNPEVTSPWDSLPFFGYLQALWQPIALLSSDMLSPAVRVTTWYLDHTRYPQCFVSREASLTGDPTLWLRQMRRIWYDVILPHDPLHFHIVQPPPPSMQPDVAAHVLLVQQPHHGFRSALVTLFDSAFVGAQPDRFATMTPSPLAFPTLIGLAYRDIDCQDPANTCDAWVGREELHPTETKDVIDGHSLVVSVHRRLPAGPDLDDPWQCLHPVAAGPDQMPKPSGSPVPIHLEYCLPDTATPPQFQEDASTLLWFANPQWRDTVAKSLDNQLVPVPAGLSIPESTCAALLCSIQDAFDPQATPVYEVYIDGATGSLHAGWAAVVVALTDGTRRLLGVTGGTVALCPTAPNWVGANGVDNIAAELTALLAANTIVLQHDTRSKFCIRPDLRLSRLLSQEVTTTKAHPRLAQLCRLAAQWTQLNTSYQEVRGHTGDPWNDLADAVAKFCTTPGNADVFPFTFAEMHTLALEPHDIAWDWIHFEHPMLAPCLPPCFDGTVMQLPACSPPQAAPVASCCDRPYP